MVNSQSFRILILHFVGSVLCLVPPLWKNHQSHQPRLLHVLSSYTPQHRPSSATLYVSCPSRDYFQLDQDYEGEAASYYRNDDACVHGKDDDEYAEEEDDISSELLTILRGFTKEKTQDSAQQAYDFLRKLIDDESEELTVKHFTTVMDALGRAGKVDLAEDVLESMPFEATRVTLNVLLRSQLRVGNVARALDWLRRMESNASVVDYNCLLAYYASNGQATEAELLIKQMVDSCNAAAPNQCASEPNLHSYNYLLEAYGKMGNAGQRALEIWRALEQQGLQVEGRTYANVVHALLNDNQVELALEKAQEFIQHSEKLGVLPGHNGLLHAAFDCYLARLEEIQSSKRRALAEKAEAIVDEMESSGSANNLIFNKLLKAWKLVDGDKSNSLARAQKVLQRMQKRKIADQISYSTMLGILANQGDKESAQQAHELVESMTSSGVQPNAQTYNNLILAFVRSGQPDRAEQVLDRMEQEALPNAIPTTVTYSTVMDAWDKSNDPRAVAKCQELFDRMHKCYEQGNQESRPNMYSYVTLIHCLSKSSERGVAQRAQDALFHLYDEYRQGHKDLMPNAQMVQMVLEAWNKSGETNIGEKAEALLEWMIAVYQEIKHEDLRPNEYAFSASIAAWSKSKRMGKMIRARKLLNRMIDLRKQGIVTAVPNAHCYTAVINSCAYCSNDELEKSDALRIAVVTYKEVLRAEHSAPNQVTYATMITALRNLMLPGEKRDSAALTVFHNAANAGYVNELVLKRIQSVLAIDKIKSTFGEAVTKNGTVRLGHLPQEWSRKVAKSRTR